MVEAQKIPAGYKMSELGVIPEDWEVRMLGDLGEPIIGLTYKPENIVPYGLFVLRSSNIKNSIINLKDSVYVDVEVKSRLLVEENDLLICVRNGSRRLIGKCALINKEAVGMTFGAFMSLYKSSFSRYIFQYFHSNQIKRQIEENMGATINQITNKNLNDFLIAIPNDVIEQESILGVLSDTDNLILTLEKLIDKKKKIKQGAIQQLLTGKKRLPGFSGEWEVKILGEIIEVYRGGSPRPIQDYITTKNDGVNWIKIGDVGLGAKYIESTEEKIRIEGIAYSRFVSSGDVLLSNSMSFGRPYILHTEGCIHDGWLVLKNFEASMTPDFLYYILSSNSIIDQYRSKAAGSGVLNLNKNLVSSVNLFIPSVSEQKAIAKVLSDMDSEIETLEKKLEKYKTIKQGMMQELLTGRIRLI